MIADSEYYGVFMDDVTEDSNVTPDANGMHLDLAGHTWTIAAYNVLPSANTTISIVGTGPNSEVDWTETVANDECFDSGGNTVTWIFNNFKFDNNSTAAGSMTDNALTSTEISDGLIIEGSGQTSGAWAQNSVTSSVTNLHIVGGGSSIQETTIGRGIAANLVYSGTMGNASQLQIDPTGTLNGFVSAITTTLTNNRGSLSSVHISGANSVLIVKTDAINTNITMDGAGSDIDFGSEDNVVLDSFVIAGFLDFTSSGADKNKVSNGEVGLATTIDGDFNEFSNIEFLAALTLSGGNNLFTNCTFGNTVTITSTADENHFSSTRFVGAVTDGGDRTIIGSSSFESTYTVSAGADFGIVSGALWNGNVSVTSDNARYDGLLNTGITFTINGTATDNKTDVTIDQTVSDSGTGSIITEIVY